MLYQNRRFDRYDGCILNPGSAMRRRDFITLLGGAAAWPLVAHAQQKVPVVGFLSSRSSGAAARLVDALRQGLKEAGLVEGQNISIQYRYAEDDYERLPALAADLVGLQPAVIVAGGTISPARQASSVIPIVFTYGFDPVSTGLVSNVSHPDGNITGFTFYSGALNAKQLELLRAIAPNASNLGFLVNPMGAATEVKIRDAQTAASAAGMKLLTFNANTRPELETGFAALAAIPNASMLVSVDPYFDSKPDQLVALAARYRVPTIYPVRDYVEAGGLISYGASITDAYRQAGSYVGQILSGKKVSELPVQFPTKFDLAINLKTAAVLGLEIPPALLATADQVIE
jgi:putative ABC transport system substrate-binding protein